MGILDIFKKENKSGQEKEEKPLSQEEAFKKARGEFSRQSNDANFAVLLQLISSFEQGKEALDLICYDNSRKKAIADKIRGSARTYEHFKFLLSSGFGQQGEFERFLALATDFKDFWDFIHYRNDREKFLQRLLELAGSNIENLTVVHEASFKEKRTDLACECLVRILYGKRTFEEYYKAYQRCKKEGAESNLDVLLLAAMQKTAVSFEEKAIVFELSPNGELLTQLRAEDVLCCTEGTSS
jgi:hypothetical protein